MSEIPREAVEAAEATLRGLLEPWLSAQAHGSTLASQIETAARLVLRDAEKAWPHNPPGHDYASTTAATTSIAPKPYSYPYGHRFGFGKPQPEAR